MFARRLNYIIELSKVTTTFLAKSANIDASYISKLRSGKRPLPKNPTFLAELSICLAKNIKEDYQIEAMCDQLNLIKWPSIKLAAKYIERWLVSGLLIEENKGQGAALKKIPKKAPETHYYYGVTGKRAAVLAFLDLVIASETKCSLLLFSDENMSWLIDDISYTKQWANKLITVLKRDHSIKIIHNINRDFKELLYSFLNWTPMYLTGNIESYYYPHFRDNVMQRTMFIADKIGAVTSSSVAGNVDGMSNQLIVNKTAVSAITREFKNYLALCRRLSQSVKYANRQVLFDFIERIDNENIKLQSISSVPNIFTMPQSVATSMQRRAPNSIILKTWQLLQTKFDALLKNSEYRELLRHPTLHDEMPYLLLGDFLGAEGLKYTRKELDQHYAHLDNLSKKYSNYRFAYSDSVNFSGNLFSFSNAGFILTNNDVKSFASIVVESDLVIACTDYINNTFLRANIL